MSMIFYRSAPFLSGVLDLVAFFAQYTDHLDNVIKRSIQRSVILKKTNDTFATKAKMPLELYDNYSELK